MYSKTLINKKTIIYICNKLKSNFMKITSFIIISVFVAILFSCKKDPVNSTTTTAGVSCLLTKKVDVTSSYTDSSFYTYNAAKKIIKIVKNSGWSKDTILYNASGNISAVNAYQNNVLYSSILYNYTGGNLTTSVKTRGAYTTTTTMTYTSGSLPSSIVMTTNDPNEQAMSILNIVWINGNFATGTIDWGFPGMQWEVTVSNDDKNNLDRFDYPNTGGDFINYFNKNNMLSISLINSETDGANTYPAGTKLFDYTMTYTTKNEVSTINELANLFNSQSRTTTCTYLCQ